MRERRVALVKMSTILLKSMNFDKEPALDKVSIPAPLNCRPVASAQRPCVVADRYAPCSCELVDGGMALQLMHQTLAPSVFDARQERQARRNAEAAEEARIRGDRAARSASRADDEDCDDDGERVAAPLMGPDGRLLLRAGEDHCTVLYLLMPWWASEWLVDLWEQLMVQHQVHANTARATRGGVYRPRNHTTRCVTFPSLL